MSGVFGGKHGNISAIREATRFARLFVLLLVALQSQACKEVSSDAESAKPAEKTARPPDVLVFMVDTLVARELGCYGSPVTQTPSIDRFARESTLFESAYSTAASTRASVASLFTGVHPEVHGVHGLKEQLSHQPSAIVRLAELMRAVGYRTAALVANPNVDTVFGFDVGFDSYKGMYAPRKSQRPAFGQELITDARAIVDEIQRLLAADSGDRPLFLFVLAIDPHAPYSPPSEYSALYDSGADPVKDGDMAALIEFDRAIEQGEERSPDRLVSLYRGEISYLDAHFGRLLQWMEQSGRLERTVIAFTSDHGEEFLQHGMRGHGHSVYEEVTHIPLIVRYPPLFPPGKRIDERVDLLDLSTTIATVGSAEIPKHWVGRSLLASNPAPRPIFSSNRWKAGQEVAVRWREHKLIHDIDENRLALYSLLSDPLEAAPLALKSTKPVKAELAGMLSEFSAGSEALRARLVSGAQNTPQNAVPREIIEKLKSLGYAQ